MRKDHRDKFSTKRPQRLKSYQPHLHGNLTASAPRTVSARDASYKHRTKINVRSARTLRRSEVNQGDHNNNNTSCSNDVRIQEVKRTKNHVPSLSRNVGNAFNNSSRDLLRDQVSVNPPRGQVRFQLSESPRYTIDQRVGNKRRLATNHDHCSRADIFTSTQDYQDLSDHGRPSGAWTTIPISSQRGPRDDNQRRASRGSTVELPFEHRVAPGHKQYTSLPRDGVHTPGNLHRSYVGAEAFQHKRSAKKAGTSSSLGTTTQHTTRHSHVPYINVSNHQTPSCGVEGDVVSKVPAKDARRVSSRAGRHSHELSNRVETRQRTRSRNSVRDQQNWSMNMYGEELARPRTQTNIRSGYRSNRSGSQLKDNSLPSRGHRSFDDNNSWTFPSVLSKREAKPKKSRLKKAPKPQSSEDHAEKDEPPNVSQQTTDPEKQPADQAVASSQYGNVVAVLTDDDIAIRRFRLRNELPFNRYTSLSVILEDVMLRDQGREGDKTLTVRKTDYNPMDMTTKLQPLTRSTPYHISLHKQRKPQSSRPEPTNPPTEQDNKTRVPPVPHHGAVADTIQLQQPAHMNIIPAFPPSGNTKPPELCNIVWPIAFASAPPYTSPGYDSHGIKQHVGVVPADRVPCRLSLGVVGNRHFSLPTWVSPLYRPYGIGGPFGPNGPCSVPDECVDGSILKLTNQRRGLIQRIKNLFKRDRNKDTTDTTKPYILEATPKSKVVKRIDQSTTNVEQPDSSIVQSDRSIVQSDTSVVPSDTSVVPSDTSIEQPDVQQVGDVSTDSTKSLETPVGISSSRENDASVAGTTSTSENTFLNAINTNPRFENPEEQF